MAWITAFGILIEVGGLLAAAFGLAKVWEEVGTGHSILTGKPTSRTVTGVAASGGIRIRSHAYGRVGKADETPEEAIAAIRGELDSLYQRLDREADARDDGDLALQARIEAATRDEAERQRVQTRINSRGAIGGLAVAVLGGVVQLVGAINGA